MQLYSHLFDQGQSEVKYELAVSDWNVPQQDEVGLHQKLT